MANTYAVSSCVSNGSTVLVSGTVNGIGVNVSFPASQMPATAVLFEAFIGPLMLAQASLPLAGFNLSWSA